MNTNENFGPGELLHREVGEERVKKIPINSDRFPFRVGAVRLAYPGTLNGIPTVHDPRPEFDGVMWVEDDNVS